jgi:type II secretory pathway pseudopilin PulG
MNANKNSNLRMGFALIEFLAVVGISAILATLTLNSFVVLNRTQALDGQTQSAISLLEKARTLSLSSKSDSNYGVHFETTRMILFKGSSYSAGSSSNEIENLNSVISISSIGLTGGVSDIVFSRLSGVASATGTVRFIVKSNSTSSSTITIFKSGLVQRN